MKILVLSHLYPNPIAKMSGRFVHNQLRLLKDHCQVEVVSPVPWFPLPGFGLWSAYRRIPHVDVLDGIRVRYPRRFALPRRVLFTKLWRFQFRALRNSVARVPDLIHAHCAYPDGRAAIEYGAQTGRPVVITVHGSDIKVLPKLKSELRQRIIEALTQAATVVAVSQELRRAVVQLGVPADRVVCIPNGVDCRLFSATGAHQPGKDGWRLLYVGRFVEAKGLRVLLAALAKVRSQGRDVSLTLVGGHPATGTAHPFLAQVEALNLSAHVSFADAVPWEDLPQYMAAADLFVLPSFSEGLTTSLVEAMACGLPVVATRCGGPEEVVNAEVGRLVAVGDAEDLAAGILAVLDEYDGYDREAISRQAEARYDYRRLAARIYALYEDVLAADKRR